MTPIGANHISLLGGAGVIALVAWRMYTRVRRMIGRQRFSRIRARLTVCMLPVLLGVLLFNSIAYSGAVLALFTGIGFGMALGIYGLRLTAFEQTPEGLYYIPNAHLGIALSLLLVGRIVYRLVHVFFSDALSAPPLEFVRSPLTLLLVGTLGGYYLAYAFGLLRWNRRERPAGI
jgi:hypothetical protein